MIQDIIIQRYIQNKKSLAVLLDPDKLMDPSKLDQILSLIHSCKVDYIFIGGSLMVSDHFDNVVSEVKSKSSIPVILFPGSIDQVSAEADAMLFLSLISGRNPELLIGNHVLAAPKIKALDLETIPTGYMLVDCGNQTTASYMSQTFPIPYNKPEIAVATAIAGEMLGLQCIYLDGGSGANRPIDPEMIFAVRENIKTPLIVGGGIKTEEQARISWQAGANIVVIGTAFEDNPELLIDISSLKESISK